MSITLFEICRASNFGHKPPYPRLAYGLYAGARQPTVLIYRLHVRTGFALNSALSANEKREPFLRAQKARRFRAHFILGSSSCDFGLMKWRDKGKPFIPPFWRYLSTCIDILAVFSVFSVKPTVSYIQKKVQADHYKIEHIYCK